MKKIKNFIKQNVGEVSISLVAASVMFVCAAFIGECFLPDGVSEYLLDAGCLSCGTALLLPFIVEPENQI